MTERGEGGWPSYMSRSDQAGRASPWFGKLRARMREHPAPVYARLAALLATVLLPILLYSCITAYAAYREALSQERRVITRLGASTAAREAQLIESTLRLLGVLIATQKLPPPPGSETQCSRVLADVVAAFAEYSGMAVSDSSGAIKCASAADALDLSVADRPWFQHLRQTHGSAVSALVRSKRTAEPVIVVAQPILTAAGDFTGSIAVSIKIRSLAGQAANLIPPPNGAAFLLDHEGTIATREGRMADAKTLEQGNMALDDTMGPFPDYARFAAAAGAGLDSFEAKGRDGILRLYSITTLPDTNIYLLYGIPRSRLFGWGSQSLVWGILGPLAMLASALLGVALGGELLVARGLRSLSKTARALKRGEYGARPRLHGGAQEMRELAGALSDMAQRVQRNESDLRRTVELKDALLRDWQHRVKNNLQVVNSLVSLQLACEGGEPNRHALVELQQRINTLSILHRHLHGEDDVRSVDLRLITQDVCQAVLQFSGQDPRRIQLEIAVPSIAIAADRAAPIALLIGECMASALRDAFRDRSGGRISIGMETDAVGVATMTIRDDGEFRQFLHTWQESPPGPRLTAMLMQAFAQQIDGALTIEGPPGTTVRISFGLFPEAAETQAVAASA